jgi:hypothetical protein
MAKSTRIINKWTDEENELCEIMASLPSLSEIAATLGRDYNAVKAKVYQIKSGEFIPGASSRQSSQYLSVDKIKGVSVSEQRLRMIKSLKIGQEIMVKEVKNKIAYRGNLIENGKHFIRVQMAHNARITTINIGEIVSKDVLIGIMKGVRAYE